MSGRVQSLTRCVFFCLYSHQQLDVVTLKTNKSTSASSVWTKRRNEPELKRHCIFTSVTSGPTGPSLSFLAVLTVVSHECLAAQFSRDL